MKRTALFVLLIILIVLAFVAYRWRYAFLDHTAGQGQLVAQATYQCDQGKTINASFYQGQEVPAQPGQMPTPSGYAQVMLSDGRTLTLNQTISADGTRYSDGDPQKQQGQPGAESFVFWSKGNGALVLEHNEQKSYIGCVKVADDPGTLPQVYESGQNGFSIRYPQGYTVDSSYQYQIGSKAISGVKFTIDPSIATGTNLASDSYVSIESLASTTSCTADKFFDPQAHITATTLTDGISTYSFASSTDAAAGNRYEEQVFAIPGTNPCMAVRYMIHWGVFENYPPGTVQEFNHDQLQAQFDAMRRTLIVNQ